MNLPFPSSPTAEQRVLEALSSLNYRFDQIDRYLKTITCAVCQLIGVDWSIVTLREKDGGRVVASSLDAEDSGLTMEHGISFALHGTLSNVVGETRQPLIVEDARIRPEFGSPPEGYLCYLGIPLRAPEGEIMGTICSFNHQPRHFTDQEIRIVELFAERAAIAIDNYRLYQQQLEFNQRLELEVARRTEELQAAQTRLMEQERLAAIGQFAAMVAHEVRNPLATVMMGLRHLQKLAIAGEVTERLVVAMSEANRLEQILGDILLYAKPQVLQLAELEINQFMREILPILQQMPAAQNRQIDYVPATSGITLCADRDKLKRVIANLITNACEAIAPGETVYCAVKTIEDHLTLEVQNFGEPISPEILPRVTEPFFSTKPARTGLGLAIASRIVEAHQGMLSVLSNAETGTIVSIQLPCSCD